MVGLRPQNYSKNLFKIVQLFIDFLVDFLLILSEATLSLMRKCVNVLVEYFHLHF